MPKPEIHLPIRYDLVIIERHKPWEGEAIFADFPTPLALQGLGTLFLWEGEFQVAGRRLFPVYWPMKKIAPVLTSVIA